MQSVDGDVRLIVRPDMASVRDAANQINNGLKGALKGATKGDNSDSGASAAKSTAKTEKQAAKETTDSVAGAVDSAATKTKDLFDSVAKAAKTTSETAGGFVRQTAEEIDAIIDAGLAREREMQEAARAAAAANNAEIMRQLAESETDVLEEATEAQEGYYSATERRRRAERLAAATAIEAANATRQNASAAEASADSLNNEISLITDLRDAFAADGLGGALRQLGTHFLMLRDNLVEAANNGTSALSKFLSLGEQIRSFTKRILSNAAALLKHASASKKANRSSTDFNTILKRGIRFLVRYGLGLRSVFVLVNRLRTAVKEGYKNLAGYSAEVNQSISSVLTKAFKLKNQVAAAFEPIVTIVVPVLNRFIEMCNGAALAVAKFFGALTGRQTVYKAKDVQQEYVETLDETAEAAKNAADAMDEYLSPLDDLNRFTDESNKGTSSGSGDKNKDSTDYSNMFETVGIEAKFVALANQVKKALREVKNFLADFFKPFHDAWQKWAEPVILAFETAGGKIIGLCVNIKESFSKVWESEAPVILDLIFETIINIVTGVGNLADAFSRAWSENDVGLRIFERIAGIIETVMEHVRNISAMFAEWALNVDFYPLLESVETLLTSIDGLLDTIGDGAERFVKNIVEPLASWTIEEALPKAIDVIAAALKIISEVGAEVGERLAFIWENFFSKLVGWVGDAIIAFLTILADFLNDIAENEIAIQFLSNLATILIVIAGVVGTVSLLPAIITGLATAFTFLTGPIGICIALIGVILLLVTHFDMLKEKFIEIRDKFVEWWSNWTFAQEFTIAVTRLFAFLKEGWKQFAQEFTATVTRFLNFLKEGWKQFAEGFTKWIVDKIPDGIKKLFTKTIPNLWSAFWGRVKTVWGTVKASVKSALEKIGDVLANAIKDGLNKGIARINSFINVINSAIQGVHTLLSWFAGVITQGVSDFLGIPQFVLPDAPTIPNIPLLAQGAVIPPNKEFMAVLGDQKSGNNIEAPEALIRKIVREESKSAGGRYEIPLIIGKREITRIVIDEGRVIMGQTGRNPFTLGV